MDLDLQVKGDHKKVTFFSVGFFGQLPNSSQVGTSKDIGPGGQISAHRCPTDLKLIPNEADGKLSK